MKKYIKEHSFPLILITITFLTLLCSGSDKSNWIWKIEGTKYTENKLDKAYESFLFIMSQQLQIPAEQLTEYVNNPGKITQPELKQLVLGLSRESFIDRYKQMILINLTADKDGFIEREDVKSKLDFINKFYIANLYLLEKVDLKTVEVSDQEAMERWEQFRATNQEYKKVPIDQGLKAMKQQITMEKAGELQGEIIQTIVESYKIESNQSNSISQYLKSKKASKEGSEKETDKKPETK